MYDEFSNDYDRFVNWPGRLAQELPFLKEQLSPLAGRRPLRILDAACGTGMHAIALAQAGFSLAGADLSAAMIARSRQNAAKAGLNIRFEAAGFGDLLERFKSDSLFPFDALICLGNSLPHLLTPAGLNAALADFYACLRPGGLLIFQNRNFETVMATHERWMEPQAYQEGTSEWLFLRFYDFQPDGLITFNILTLQRQSAQDAWKQSATTTRLRPLLLAELLSALSGAGFSQASAYGNMAGAPFEPAASPNLVLVCRK